METNVKDVDASLRMKEAVIQELVTIVVEKVGAHYDHPIRKDFA